MWRGHSCLPRRDSSRRLRIGTGPQAPRRVSDLLRSTPRWRAIRGTGLSHFRLASALQMRQTELAMPQLQLPVFPSGSKNITEGIAVECRDKQVVYFCGLLPVFQHAEGDLQTFRLITSQLIDMGAVRQVDIVDAFGVPLPTVKRYLKLLREFGPKVFFKEPERRSASVLTSEVRQIVERLIAEGRSVPEVAEAS